MKPKNITNIKFGKLLALKITSDKDESGSYYWECLCDCGNLYKASLVDLNYGSNKSCGCLRKKRPYEHTYNNLIRDSSKRNIQCSLTYEDLLEFIKIKNCHYCNSEINWHPHWRNKDQECRLNLDRKNSNIGYQINNLVVCCPNCNRGKNNIYSYEEWVVMTKALKEFHHERINV
jgi:hypothetical protein